MDFWNTNPHKIVPQCHQNCSSGTLATFGESGALGTLSSLTNNLYPVSSKLINRLCNTKSEVEASVTTDTVPTISPVVSINKVNGAVTPIAIGRPKPTNKQSVGSQCLQSRGFAYESVFSSPLFMSHKYDSLPFERVYGAYSTTDGLAPIAPIAPIARIAQLKERAAMAEMTAITSNVREAESAKSVTVASDQKVETTTDKVQSQDKLILLNKSLGQQELQKKKKGKLSNAIPFIQRKTPSGKLFVDPRAVTALNRIKGKIAIIFSTGEVGVGKSYLLNCVSELATKINVNNDDEPTRSKDTIREHIYNFCDVNDFPIAETSEVCTAGIWMRVPYRVGDVYHVILDSQGFDGEEAANSVNRDYEIFICLGLLISSLILVHSNGLSTKKALAQFGMLTENAQQLQIKINKTSAVSDKTGQKSHVHTMGCNWPSLLWVMRDTSAIIVDKPGKFDFLPLHQRNIAGATDSVCATNAGMIKTSEHTNTITASKYFNTLLRENVSTSDKGAFDILKSAAHQKKNEIKTGMRRLFYQRDCVAVCRPIEMDTSTQFLSGLAYSKLNPSFQKSVEDLTRKLIFSVDALHQPKGFQTQEAHVNQAHTGASFVSMVKIYLKEINENKIPNFSKCLDQISYYSVEKAILKAKDVFTRALIEKSKKNNEGAKTNNYDYDNHYCSFKKSKKKNHSTQNNFKENEKSGNRKRNRNISNTFDEDNINNKKKHNDNDNHNDNDEDNDNNDDYDTYSRQRPHLKKMKKNLNENIQYSELEATNRKSRTTEEKVQCAYREAETVFNNELGFCSIEYKDSVEYKNALKKMENSLGEIAEQYRAKSFVRLRRKLSSLLHEQWVVYKMDERITEKLVIFGQLIIEENNKPSKIITTPKLKEIMVTKQTTHTLDKRVKAKLAEKKTTVTRATGLEVGVGVEAGAAAEKKEKEKQSVRGREKDNLLILHFQDLYSMNRIFATCILENCVPPFCVDKNNTSKSNDNKMVDDGFYNSYKKGRGQETLFEKVAAQIEIEIFINFQNERILALLQKKNKEVLAMYNKRLVHTQKPNEEQEQEQEQKEQEEQEEQEEQKKQEEQEEQQEEKKEAEGEGPFSISAMCELTRAVKLLPQSVTAAIETFITANKSNTSSNSSALSTSSVTSNILTNSIVSNSSNNLNESKVNSNVVLGYPESIEKVQATKTIRSEVVDTEAGLKSSVDNLSLLLKNTHDLIHRTEIKFQEATRIDLESKYSQEMMAHRAKFKAEEARLNLSLSKVKQLQADSEKMIDQLQEKEKIENDKKYEREKKENELQDLRYKLEILQTNAQNNAHKLNLLKSANEGLEKKQITLESDIQNYKQAAQVMTEALEKEKKEKQEKMDELQNLKSEITSLTALANSEGHKCGLEEARILIDCEKEKYRNFENSCKVKIDLLNYDLDHCKIENLKMKNEQKADFEQKNLLRQQTLHRAQQMQKEMEEQNNIYNVLRNRQIDQLKKKVFELNKDTDSKREIIKNAEQTISANKGEIKELTDLIKFQQTEFKKKLDELLEKYRTKTTSLKTEVDITNGKLVENELKHSLLLKKYEQQQEEIKHLNYEYSTSLVKYKLRTETELRTLIEKEYKKKFDELNLPIKGPFKTNNYQIEIGDGFEKEDISINEAVDLHNMEKKNSAAHKTANIMENAINGTEKGERMVEPKEREKHKETEAKAEEKSEIESRLKEVKETKKLKELKELKEDNVGKKAVFTESSIEIFKEITKSEIKEASKYIDVGTSIVIRSTNLNEISNNSENSEQSITSNIIPDSKTVKLLIPGATFAKTPGVLASVIPGVLANVSPGAEDATDSFKQAKIINTPNNNNAPNLSNHGDMDEDDDYDWDDGEDSEKRKTNKEKKKDLNKEINPFQS